MTLAWHFTEHRLRDGRPIPPVGEWLEYDGPLKLCESGLHASVDIMDALQYAPGAILHRVELGGEIIEGDDKLVASRRRIIWSVDLTDALRVLARKCALDVIHLWDAPDVVRQYLETGDESLRSAARAAAGDATRVAARAAAQAAAQDAARVAARIAERNNQRERLLEMIAKKSGRER